MDIFGHQSGFLIDIRGPFGATLAIYSPSGPISGAELMRSLLTKNLKEFSVFCQVRSELLTRRAAIIIVPNFVNRAITTSADAPGGHTALNTYYK